MTFYYNGAHSVTIGEKNTWKDWSLIPFTRPSFQPPLPKNNFAEIPGGNGTLDLSESLTGYVLYEDRVGSWEFIVSDQATSWYDIYSDILSYLQGKRFNAVLEDDKYFHYQGRFWLNEERSEPESSRIVIEYQVYPYKMEPNSSNEPWLWDPFDFKYGVIRNSYNLEVNGTLTVILPRSIEPVSPIIVATGNGLSVRYGGVTYPLQNGTNIIPQILVHNQEVTLVFTGNGTISVNYRGGRL